MKITITGRKCSPRDSFREHAEKKLAKIERFFGPDVEAKVTVTVEKSSQSVEITVNNNGMVFRAQERAENMNEALDKCVDTLIRQIRKIRQESRRSSRPAASTLSPTRRRAFPRRRIMSSSGARPLSLNPSRSMKRSFR